MPIKTKVSDDPKESAASKLDRSKLHSTISSKPEMPEEGSLRAIIILIVVIVVVAVGGAFFIKSLQNKVSENTSTQPESSQIVSTPTQAPSKEDLLISKIVKTEVEMDANAQDKSEIEQFIQEDKAIESENASSYKLASLLAQPYESFYRIIFTFSSDEELQTNPRADINYRNIVSEIEITFANVEDDQTGLIAGQSISIPDSVVTNIVRSGKSDEKNLVYQIKMSQSAMYAVQAKQNQIILDVLELEDIIQPEITEEPDEETEAETTPTPEVTQKPVTSTGKNITSEISGNSAGIKGFTYSDSMERFRYQLILSNEKVPNVTSSISGNEISVTVKNLAFDGVASDPVVSKADFQASGVRNVQSMQASFASNSSTYVFKLEKQADYELKETVVDGVKRISIEFIH